MKLSDRLSQDCLRHTLHLSIGLCFSLAAWAGPGAHGPNGEHLDAPAAVNTSGLQRLADGSVLIPKLSQRRMGIRTQIQNPTQTALTHTLPARVIGDPNASGRVQVTHGGEIEAAATGLPLLGQTVKKGQLLAYVRHHADPFDRANQHSLLQALQAQRELAEQQLQRYQQLGEAIARKELQEAEVNWHSLKQRETILKNSLNTRETLRAPVSGVISQVNVVLGQVVEPQTVLFEIIDPQRVLLEANTNRPELIAQIEQANLADKHTVKLKLVGGGRILREGLLPVIFQVQDGAETLAIGQALSVLLQLKQKQQGIVLPAQAVVRNSHNEAIVWIKAGAERFIPQPVQFMPLDSQRVVITHGLGADNRVVVEGASLITQIH